MDKTTRDHDPEPIKRLYLSSSDVKISGVCGDIDLFSAAGMVWFARRDVAV